PNLKQGMLPYANYFWPAPNGPEVLNATTGLPTGTAYNFNNGVQKTREEVGLTRVDYVLSPSDTLYTNYTISDGARELAQTDAIFIHLVRIRSQSFSLSETRVFSSTVVNSATLGWARNIAAHVQTPVTPIPDSLLFLGGGNPGQIVIKGGATS